MQHFCFLPAMLAVKQPSYLNLVLLLSPHSPFQPFRLEADLVVLRLDPNSLSRFQWPEQARFLDPVGRKAFKNLPKVVLNNRISSK
jgi:hypothetical protein